mmetsp:Transcript_18881/g.48006  ORF Transcript_18881/g.48006 Transcript_18881/m.48006 type:complete len:101 (-) Transcript_18881:3822-4124(-)|eukprot:CAMPEP_0113883478 /NCGR_PEP_ID=MMETSP0780_2-20120614/9630_1 /TAXON_ID=652834 /ORGANISM="Palpitomonas bilix" /LENGTH=100 /DNA_ID=CAMNT_0000870803 /DNA_START=232 /DNA_END=534 /DNA_ORIENTATION=+ /assembly_acc=CAM_ASM_000599
MASLSSYLKVRRNNQMVFVEVDMRENIGAIKEKIEHVLKQPAAGQRLYLGAQLLDDAKVPEDFGIKHGDLLDVAFSKEDGEWEEPLALRKPEVEETGEEA